MLSIAKCNNKGWLQNDGTNIDEGWAQWLNDSPLETLVSDVKISKAIMEGRKIKEEQKQQEKAELHEFRQNLKDHLPDGSLMPVNLIAIKEEQ